jgi:hypothetical protein
MQGPGNQLQLYRNVITIGMRTTDPDALAGLTLLHMFHQNAWVC